MNTARQVRHWLLAAMACMAALPLHAAADKPPLLMVGDNWCPYNCAPDAPRRGYMVEVLERVLAPYFTLSYKLEPWSRAIVMVETGEAQLLVGTPASTGQKTLASAPLGVDQSCFFVRKGNPWRYTRVGDLKRIRLGVIQDYSYDDNGPLDALIAAFRRHNDPRLEVAVGENALENNFRKLEAGRMDVVLENENVGRYMVQELKLQDAIDLADCATHHVATTHVAVSLTRADARQILQRVNKGLAELRRSGELASILKVYGMADWQNSKTHKPAR
ncbi:MAG: transporter substrate-binding domain-containing protein [Rhodoferax sp.]|nr:transporter substrate-binding domain-containing protein [Rhodoferax sp.]